MPFCTWSPDRTFLDTEHVLAPWDAYPVSPGHALVLTRRHVADWFDATDAERIALTTAIENARHEIERDHRPDGLTECSDVLRGFAVSLSFGMASVTSLRKNPRKTQTQRRNRGCPGGWTGQIRTVYTFDESRVITEPSGTTERHEREEQSWTVVKTELVKPPAQQTTVEQLTTAFHVTSSVNDRQTSTSTCFGPPPRTGTETSTRAANSGFAETSFFQAFPLSSGTFSLTPIAPGHGFQLPVTTTNYDECDGTSSTGQESALIAENFPYLTITPGLVYLTPLPNDPGHFAGSASVLHSELPVNGGTQSIDLSVSWDLRRTLAR